MGLLDFLNDPDARADVRERVRNLLGAGSDPTFWKDVGNNAVTLNGRAPRLGEALKGAYRSGVTNALGGPVDNAKLLGTAPVVPMSANLSATDMMAFDPEGVVADAETKAHGLLNDLPGGADWFGTKLQALGLVPAQTGSGAELAGELASAVVNPRSLLRRPKMDIVGGKGGLLADKATLAQAEEALAKGVDPAQVVADTGWWRGPDGQMRFEISDDTSRFKPGVASMTKPQMGSPYFIKVGDVLDHPELYANYPDIERMGLFVYNQADYPRVGGFHGKYQGQPVLGMSASYLNQPDVGRQNLLHEVDHHVQMGEGFARGASPAKIKGQLPDLELAEKGLLTKANDNYEKAWQNIGPAERALTYNKLDEYTRRERLQPRLLKRSWLYDWRDATDKFGKMPRRPGPQRDAWTQGVAGMMRDKVLSEYKGDPQGLLSLAADPAEARRIIGRNQRAQQKLAPAARKYREIERKYGNAAAKTADENYLAAGGEVQSRAVESRLHLTPAERRARPFWKSLSVPEAEQLGLGELPAQLVLDRIPKRYLK